MKITRISGKPLSGKCIAMTAIASDLQRSGKAVLQCHGQATTANILAMCTKPVPFAIMLHDYDPTLVDLDVLMAEPTLDKVLCYVEIDETKLLEVVACQKCYAVFEPGAGVAGPDDELDDVLPLSTDPVVPIELLIASDSEGGHHD